MEDRKAIQGTGDGLCGFYALINFLLRENLTEKEGSRSEKQEAFRYLAEAAERLKLLTPIKLVAGFEWHELLEIFNYDAARRHTGFRALAFKDVFVSSDTLTAKKMVSDILGEGGALVALVERGTHWVLVYGKSGRGRLAVADPSHSDPEKELDRIDNLVAGLAILPLSSALLKANDA